jgi:hypothetical protein
LVKFSVLCSEISSLMSPDEITSFFAAQGSTVIKTTSCSWFNDYHQNQVYQSFPMHRLISPSRDELREVFAKAPGAVALRFIGPANSKGKESFIWLRRGPYALEDLSPNTRSRIRRGLKRCEIKPLQFEELESKAWDAHRDTTKRHGYGEPSSLGVYSRLDDCAAYEAWGSFVGDALAAFAVTMRVEDWAHIIVNRSATAYLGSYANNVLIFSVVSELLARDEVNVVSYGIEGLVTHDSLDRFKSSMGFTREPVRQRIVLKPLLKPLVNPLTVAPITALAELMRNNLRLQRLAGFCRLASRS